jgi:UDP-glucose 4-epimerase
MQSWESVVGIARRRPRIEFAKTDWATADIARDDLLPLLRGADAVVHLAWLIQPTRDPPYLERVTVDGSKRVFAAVREAGVPALVYASSIGAYSPGPKDRRVDESWPTGGVATNLYSQQKARVERLLDAFEAESPDVRVVRLRPQLIFKRESATEQRRIFAGPFLPSRLVRPGLVPVLPDIPGLRLQCVHSYDVGEAYRLAATRDVRGAFNVAAEPTWGMREVADLLRARLVTVEPRVVRGFAKLAWRTRLTPIHHTWLDLAMASPLLDSTRAREELGWTPRFGALETLRDLLEGMRKGADFPTPPLAQEAGSVARAEEVATGLGERE